MKCCGILALLLFAIGARAQEADSLLISSLLPIEWSFDVVVVGGTSVNPFTDTVAWSGKMDWGYYDTKDFDSTTTLTRNGKTYTLTNRPTYSRDYNRLTVTIDTVSRVISSLQLHQELYSDEAYGDISTTFHYSLVNNKFISSQECACGEWNGQTSNGWGHWLSDVDGWVSIGGSAPPPADVKAPPTRDQMSVIYTFDGKIRLTFHQSSSNLRILDLLGRERATINVEPGATSAELNTAGFAPGVYFVVLGGVAVKFVAR